MNFDVTRDQWVERFALRLANLVPGAAPDAYAALAEALWPTRGQMAPEAAAEAEHAARGAAPPPDAEPGRFERTERIPVERIQSAEDYVRDDAEWSARCVARVLELDPIIRREEAERSVADLAGLERWRLLRPEAAAEQLYTPIKPRNE